MRQFRRDGWAPVRWSHHPPVIKQLIHKGGFRPKAKSCFENCVQLVMAALGSQYEDDIRYCEGWVTSKVLLATKHAWLLYCGEIVDLTLVGRKDIQYGRPVIMTPKQVVEALRTVGTYGPFTGEQVDIRWAENLTIDK